VPQKGDLDILVIWSIVL